MKKYILLSFCFILALSLLSACGSASPGKPVTTLNVSMAEFAFNPNVMTVPASQPITLNLKNTGAVDHDFVILKKGKSPITPFDKEKQAADILIDFRLSSNQSGTYQFTLPESGDYTVICGMQGHLESGMTAKITAVTP